MMNKMDFMALERLQIASRAAGCGVFDWDTQKNEIFYDDIFMALFGLEHYENANNLSSFYNAMIDEDAVKIKAIFSSYLLPQSSINNFEQEFSIKANGKILFISVKGIILRNKLGEGVRLIGACQDISARKKMELEKQELERVQGDLLEYIPGFVFRCLYKEDWEMTYLSTQMSEITGYFPSEIERNNLLSYKNIIFHNDRERVIKSVNAQLESGDTFKVEYRILHKNGKIVWVCERGKAIRDKQGRILCLEGFIQDITENVSNREELVQMLNNTQEYFVLLDRNLGIKCFNNSFKEGYKELFQKDVEKGKNIIDYAEPNRRNDLYKMYHKVLQGNTKVISRTFKDQSNKDRSFVFTYSPAKNENEVIIGVFCSIKENTNEVNARNAEMNMWHKFQMLVENSRDGINILNGNLELIFTSKATIKILGYETHELLNKKLDFIIHPDDRFALIEIYNRALSQPRVLLKAILIRVLHKRGEYRWIDLTIINCLHDSAINGLIVNFRDFTEIINAEKARSESESRFRLIAQATNDFIWDYDFQTNTTWGNESLFAFYGFKLGVDELNFEGFIEKIHPDDVKRLNVLIISAFKKRMVNITSTYRMLNVHGKYRELYARAFTIYSIDGKPMRMIGAMKDVTEKNQAEKMVLDLNRRLTLATTAAKLGIFEWDYQQNVIIWDKAMFQIHNRIERTGTKVDVDFWINLIHIDDMEGIKNEFDFSDRTQESYYSSYRIGINEEEKYIDIYAIITRDYHGMPLKITGICKDESIRERQIETINRQNQKLKKIAWTQAHVVRAPLANIIGMVNLIFEETNREIIDDTRLTMLRKSAIKFDMIVREMVLEAEKLESLKN